MLADELTEVLRHRPGLTADELAAALSRSSRASGASRSPRSVDLALHQGRERFWFAPGQPRRWWLQSDKPPPGGDSGPGELGLDGCWEGPGAGRGPGGREEGSVGGEPGSSGGSARHRSALPKLYRWQEDALRAWVQGGRRGVVEAVTGAGKTVLGLAAVLEALRSRRPALVVVPTVELLHQWRARVAAAIPRGYSVGHLGDGGSATFLDHDVLVGVVNSLRDRRPHLTRPGGLLVADECHRYGSVMNRLALDERFEWRLGLSATYARDDDGHLAWLDPYFGGTCFELGYRRAVQDGVTARVLIALVGVELAGGERARYDELTEEIGLRYARLVNRLGLPSEPFSAFLRAVNALAAAASDPASGTGEARAYLLAVRERRWLLAEAGAKMQVLGRLAPALAAADRSIVFTRSIASAQRAAAVLAGHGLRVGVVHSGVHPLERRAVLAGFGAGELQAISAPHVLDEGVDVPEADLAVIVGASRSRRQMVQRMGRVLRKKPDDRYARFALLYAEQTIEDPDLGAHEGFLEEVIPVADEVGRYSDSRTGEIGAAIDFLGPRSGRRAGASRQETWSGTPVPVRSGPVER